MGRMSPIAKWIGGATLAVLGVLGALLFAGRTLEAASNDPEQWLAEDDLLAHAEAKPVAPTPPALAPVAERHWDEEGVPGGPLVVTVDLQARVISVFRGGYEIGAAAVMLGTDQHPTPTGVFPILTKERHNVSEKYDNAPMPWTLRLTHDGVAIHGGNEVERGFASHGCIGTPDGFVSKLFAIAKPGDKVIITDGKKASIGAPLI
jgi:lipoprotein-anchoring transpeptidase ErfK/SrfK